MRKERLEELLAKLPDISILAVGDFFLDKYLILDHELAEVSIETGLTAHQVTAKRLSPGAAGTVTSNLRALGAGSVMALSVIGVDGEGFELKRALEATGVDTANIIETDSRFTPTYTKPMLLKDGVESELERQDIKNRAPLPRELEEEIIFQLRVLVPQVEGVVISDQVQERNCGVITDRVREEIARLAREYSEVWFLADSRVRIGEFRDICVKPNKFEAARAIQPDYSDTPDEVKAGEFGRELASRMRHPVFMTMEDKGVAIYKDGAVTTVPAVPVEGEIDPVGAGDSCVAGIICGLSAGGSCEEAAALGNLTASVTVKKLGATGTASPDEIMQAFHRWPGRVRE